MVTVPSLNRRFPGKVTPFADRVQSATRTMTTEVDLKNPELKLIPGMFAQVQLTLADAPNTVAVPLGAIDGIGNTSKLYVVDTDDIVHLRNVCTGMQSPQFIQVLSGAQPGEAVILGNHSGLEDGERVEPHFE